MMTRQLRLFLVALQFYSRIPVTGRLAAWMGWDPSWLGGAVRYFPLVGIVVAIGQSVVYIAASTLLPHPVALLLAIAAGLLLTGAFHEDGWADFCDGFGGGNDRARTLAIMRDSRIGAYGAIGIATLLLMRFETLAHVEADWVVATLVCAAAFSRGCSVLVMASLRYARDEADAKAKPIAEHVTGRDAVVALGLAIAPSAALVAWTGDWAPAAAAGGVALLATAALRRMMRRRLGGYTGDALGAVQQLAELGFLIGLLAVLGLPPETGPDDPDADDEEEP
ncbi:MAG: cobalamin-5-phosphate synthase [Pseudomonadota bacterium]|jgi:adenosylcobinamide-GDP ribazoletransferase